MRRAGGDEAPDDEVLNARQAPAGRSVRPAPVDGSTPAEPVTAELVIGGHVLEHVTITARVDGRSLRMVTGGSS